MIKLEELRRGSTIEYQITDRKQKNYLSFVKDTVYGVTTDDNGIDYVEVGKSGRTKFIELSDVKPIEVTDKTLEELGFIKISNNVDCITFYRDDIGYLKLGTYGVESMLKPGLNMRYLHRFENCFYETNNYTLRYRESKQPEKKKKFTFELHKSLSPDEALNEIKKMKNTLSAGDDIFKDVKLF